MVKILSGSLVLCHNREDFRNILNYYEKIKPINKIFLEDNYFIFSKSGVNNQLFLDYLHSVLYKVRFDNFLYSYSGIENETYIFYKIKRSK